MTRVLRAAVLAFALSAATAVSGGTAQADSDDCVRYLRAQGYEPVAAVGRACRTAEQGTSEARLKCLLILRGEGITGNIAREACDVASRPRAGGLEPVRRQ